MRFDDIEYVKHFKETGEYPKIHDDIFSLDKYVPKGNVLDLGCCTGLLTHRLAQKHNVVVGVEANKNNLFNAVRDGNNIFYKHLKITKETLPDLERIVKNFGINIVYARRVIPEIYDAGGYELVRDMIRMFRDNGVECIVVEGRKCNSNSTHYLKSIEEEKKMFYGFYDCIKVYNQCAIFTK